jgi:hypothetical protein
MLETATDLAAFTDPNEFGVSCVLHAAAGDVPFTAIVASHHESSRVGGNNNSSISPFHVGIADMNMSSIRALATWSVVSMVKPNDRMTVLAGDYAGEYRVRDPQRDGAICRMMINKL